MYRKKQAKPEYLSIAKTNSNNKTAQKKAQIKRPQQESYLNLIITSQRKDLRKDHQSLKKKIPHQGDFKEAQMKKNVRVIKLDKKYYITPQKVVLAQDYNNP